MDEMCKSSDDYKSLGSQASQMLMKMLDKSWKSYFVAIKDWKKNPEKYFGMPKLPGYKAKNGRQVFTLKNIQCSINDGIFRISFKPFKGYTVPTKITGKLMECRFVPMGVGYMMEIVHEVEVPEITGEPTNIASIDLGIDNFATIVNNIGVKPIVIKGGSIKSMNQYYNKKKALMRSELKKNNNKNISKKLKRFSEKHRFKTKDWMHKTSKYVVDYCVLHGIDTLVCGYNEKWKQKTNIGKKNNQNFSDIPYLMFINQLIYKCENNGIRFITTEENYTSGTSFLDKEKPIKENYNKSRRIKRGLFKSNNGTLINADVNGAYQIMTKVFPNVFSDGIEGVGLHPKAVYTT